MKKFILILIILFSLFVLLINSKGKQQTESVSFASWGSQSEVKILKELISDYEKKSNIKIDFIHIPQNYFQKIQLLFASGLEPDVVFFNNQNIKMYIEANLLEDLSPYINEHDFFPQAINCFIEDNKVYAIPRDISTLVIYYNKDLLRSLGIKLNKNFNDFQSFINILKEIKSKNNFAINYEENPIFWVYFLNANGGGILTDDGKELLINSTNSINSLQLYSDLINKYHVIPTKAQLGSKTSAQMFINKEIAMYLSGRWMIPKFRETINFDWDIIQFPSSEQNKLYADASGWAVSKRSKHKQQAIDFIKFLSSEESLSKLAQTGLIIPAEISAAKSTIKNDMGEKPFHSSLFLEMLSNTRPTPVNKKYASINDIITERASLIFSGDIKAEDAFDENTLNELNKQLH